MEKSAINSKKKKYLDSEKVGSAFIIFLTIIILIAVAYPLYYVLIASFSDPYDVYAGKTFLFPSNFNFNGYKAVFSNDEILTGLTNSIFYTIIGTAYSLFMVFSVAYPLSKRDLPGRKSISIFFLITMYFTGGLIPTYLIAQRTGLVGNVLALLLPGGVAVGHVILARNYFEHSIPQELIEAADIDGASQLKIFTKVVLPLSKPIITVIAVYSMVSYWNDWFTPMIYLRREQASLQLVLRDILFASSYQASSSGMISGGYAELNKISESIKFSSIVIAALPMLVIYQFVQRYFEKGMMVGAVKG